MTSMNTLRTFAQSAKDLSRNPLGIIALFILLVYAMASVVLGLSGRALSDFQKDILVFFLTLFPCVVLAAFYRLVAKHHFKLYAPVDFGDAKHFLAAMTPEEKEAAINEDVEVVASTEIQTDGSKNLTTTTPPHSSTESEAETETRFARTQDFRNRYKQVERYLLNKKSTELGKAIERNVRVEAGGIRLFADGVIREGNTITIVEVKYAPSGRIGNITHFLDKLLYQIYALSLALRETADIDVKLLLLIASHADPVDLAYFQRRLSSTLHGLQLDFEYEIIIVSPNDLTTLEADIQTSFPGFE